MSTPGPAACPHCAAPMREVTARARSGYLLTLDQCTQCGGVWCDRWELFPLDAAEAARLDAVDATRLYAATPPTSAPGRCPRCQCALQPFCDPSLPADARIERCRVCDGMWMNRGELLRAKRRTSTRPPPDGALQRLAAAYGATAQWSKVANLDAATYAAEEDVEADGDLRATLWSATPWIVLRVLLRLLLRI